MGEYVGLDVSTEETGFCVIDATGKIVAQGKALSDPQSLFEALREPRLCPERIVVETGTLSGWLARGWRAGLNRQTVPQPSAKDPSPAGTMAKAIPRAWLQGGQASAIAPDTLGGRSPRAL